MLRQLTTNQSFVRLRMFLAKYWLVLVGGTLFVIILCALILRFMTPTLTPPTNPPLTEGGNQDGSQTEFFGLTFSGKAPVVPEKMWLAKVTNLSEANSEALLTSLTEAYQLKPSPNVKNIWIGPDYSLELDPTTNEYRLAKNLSDPTVTSQIISPSSVSQLIGVAEKKVQAAFPTTIFKSFPNQVQLLTGGGEFSPATSETATHLSVPFGPSFYGVPVVLNFDRGLPMVVFLDAKGQIVKVVARPFSADFEATTQHNTLSIQEAMQQIEQGNASIIDSYSTTTGNPDLEKVVRGEFTDASLEYRIDPATNLLIPYYHFVGTLVNGDNDIFSADVITPAVRLEQ